MDGVCSEDRTWYTEKIKTYLAGENGTRKNYKCALINKEVGDDCSSMVSACLVSAGIDTNVWYSSYSYNKNKRDFNATLGNNLKKGGFVWHSFTEQYIPQRGDISVQHETYQSNKKTITAHHVEVVDSYDERTEVCYIWSWGEVNSTLPVSRTNWKVRTSGYWRIEV